MPRKKLIHSSVLPYHITSRHNNRERFPIELNRVWEIFSSEATRLSWIYGAEFQSLVLMPNHFHAIITVPQFDLGKIMSIFLAHVTREINGSSRRSGHVLGGPYHWSLITNPRYYGHAFKYIYRNPVKAGLCDRVEEYPYSTLFGQSGGGRLPIPLHFTRAGMEAMIPDLQDFTSWLDWLNTPFTKETSDKIQKSIYKREIKASFDRYKRPKDPELELLL